MAAEAPSLLTRLRRQFLVLGIVPLLVVFAAAWALLVPVLVEQAESRNRELALAVRDQVRLQLETRQRSAGFIANMVRNTSTPRESLLQAMQSLIEDDTFLQAVYVVDDQGRVIEAALSPSSGRFAADAIGQDLTGQPFYSSLQRGS